MKKLRGILPPLVATFEDGTYSSERFHENMSKLTSYDLGGYLVLGSTGEAVLLSEEEKLQIVRDTRLVTPDDKALIVGTGMPTVEETLHLSREVADCGADAVLVISPHYFKKQMTAESQVAFFTAVADKCPIPVLLYNMPALTGVSIEVETVVKLSQHKNIIGIKDSSGDMAFMTELCQQLPKEFRILSGSASVVAYAMMAGAVGGILALANIAPEPLIEMAKMLDAGKYSPAIVRQKELISASRVIVGKYGVPGVKAAMSMRGLYGGEPRLPLLPLDKPGKKEIEKIIDGLEVGNVIPSRKIK